MTALRSPSARSRGGILMKMAVTKMCVVALVLFSCASSALAHPLGNFTVNHYSRVEVGAERIRLRYVVDLAEIPTVQELRVVDADGDGTPTGAELNAYLERVAPEYAGNILLTVDGALGLGLFVRRLSAALGATAHHHHHDHSHEHAHQHEHGHAHGREHGHLPHQHADGSAHVHARGGRAHSHLPPGADDEPVTWRSLLALGISGGLLPCPSALGVMLAAIAGQRVGFGLLLIVAFSLGLAAVGLVFVYAGRWMKATALGAGRQARVLPVVSAAVIACVGVALCYEALLQAGVDLGALFAGRQSPTTAASVLSFGLVLGLKHAVEADHLAAVTTIVSERKSVLSASLVGGLWGVGHTVSLLVAGVAVILLRVEIGRRTELALEFCVALMLVALGANAIRKLFRGGRVHLHAHRHGGHWHAHPHVHEGDAEGTHHAMSDESHHGLRLGGRPFLVGMLHGLAGSAALMLLVLSTIHSPLVGLVYVAVFGLGSVGGMMLMSALVGLPVHFTAGRFTRANLAIRCLAGLFSLGFGLFMVYEIGFVDGLFL